MTKLVQAKQVKAATPAAVLLTPADERNRRGQVMPESTVSAPVGVEPATTSPSGQSSQEERPARDMTALWRNARQLSRKPGAVFF